MGVFQNNLMGAAAAAASAGGGDFYSHQIANSARCDSNGGYLKRTPSSAGNRATWTFSTWVKRSVFTSGSTQIIYSAGSSGDQDGYYRLYWYQDSFIISSANANFATPSDKFRDPSAWYHIVWKQGSNATTLYVNNRQVTTASVSGNTAVNNNVQQVIANNSMTLGDSPMKGYIAETIMIDGTALGPDSFGETKNGVWIPKDASGLTFGTNGFHLKYESSSDLGNDSSGNNNDWTAVDLAAHDQMLDTPTFNSDSNGGNFATYNPLTKGTYTDLSEGNCRADSNTGADASYPSGNFAMTSGKWYYEQLIGNLNGSYPTTGLVALNNLAYDVTRGTFYAMRLRSDTGVAQQNSGDNVAPFGTITVNTTGVASVGTGDIVSWYVDMDNKKAWFAKNGTIPNSGDPANGTNPQFSWTTNPSGGITFMSQEYQTSYTVVNAGQDGTFAGEKTAQGNSDDTGYGNFYYDPPTVFLALCSGNLPVVDEIDPAQTDDNYPQKLFGMLQYTGNGSERTIDTSFQIDYSWARSTVQGQNWYALDTTRGFFGASSNNLYMKLDVDDAEDTLSQYNFKAQSGSDITITSGTAFNSGTHTQQMWNWRLNGGTTSTNSSGSVNVTQQVDPSGHFSVSTYSGAGGTGTIGHGLSAVPTFVVVKQRNGSNSWATYAKGAGPELYGNLATNTAFQDAVVWQDTTPSSSLVYLGDNNEVNHSGRTYLAYCWADCEGYIKSGKYIGNGNADGSFIHLGFKPALFVIKHVSSGDDPLVWDSKNGLINPISKTLSMHDSSAIVDNSNRNVDFLSNGVKIRTSNSNANSTNSDGIVYLAMAHNPFKYATAR